MTEAAGCDGMTHFTDVEVRFRDTDAKGHVNNAVYLTYLEVARQAYWRRVAAPPECGGFPFVVGRAAVEFRSPSTVGETLRVGLRIDWVSRGSFGMSYAVRERDTDRLVVEASTVLVTFDYAARRAMPVPAWLRAELERIEGRSLPDKPRPA
jgi:acyl-CoA thioester hydrolase